MSMTEVVRADDWVRLGQRRTDRHLEVGWTAGSVFLLGVTALAVWSPEGLAVLVGLTVLVLIHEGGHLIAARRCSIDVTEYFAGFGPVVVAWRTAAGLRVGLKAIPAGGYVRVIGMSSREHIDLVDEPRTFRAAPRTQRLAVVAAGPVVNIVFGFLLLVGASIVEGNLSVAQAIAESWRWTADIITGTMHGLGAVLSDLGSYGEAILHPTEASAAPTRFLSPIGVAQVSTDLAAHGPAPLIRLMAIASIGLGVMNALPLPPLDGGHAALIGVEAVAAKVRREPRLRLDVGNRVVAVVTAVTFALVIMLGVSALLFDVASPISL